MGNSIPQGTSKVVFSDGTVHCYDKPLTVAELMLEHPQQMVVEFKLVAHGKRPIPLPADMKLEKNKAYIMLPIRKGKPSSLSSEEARKILTKTSTMFKSKSLLASYTGFLPVFARICPAAVSSSSLGTGRDHVLNSDKNLYLLKKEKEDEGSKHDYFSDILEGRPEFLSRQLSGKGWKPSLDTIKEKSMQVKIRHWLF
ncbi:putative beta-D-xylosidase 2-like [Capsicum annuum]|nr:putative beta-D-xylosidase 2-like [Capsicum annuum]